MLDGCGASLDRELSAGCGDRVKRSTRPAEAVKTIAFDSSCIRLSYCCFGKWSCNTMFMNSLTPSIQTGVCTPGEHDRDMEWLKRGGFNTGHVPHPPTHRGGAGASPKIKITGKKRKRAKKFLELYAGGGVLSKHLKAKGWETMPVDIKDGWDLLDPGTQEEIIRLIRSKQVDLVHLAPVCTSFCIAYYGPWITSGCTRSSSNPQGNGTVPKEVTGNRHVHFICRVIDACNESGTAWSMEQPQTSLMWLMPGVASRISHGFLAHFCMCMYGMLYKKPTTFAGSGEWVRELARKCIHKRHEVVLSGGGPGGKHMTQLAALYPEPLGKAYAAAADRALGEGDETPPLRAGKSQVVHQEAFKPGVRVPSSIEGTLPPAGRAEPPPPRGTPQSSPKRTSSRSWQARSRRSGTGRVWRPS